MIGSHVGGLALSRCRAQSRTSLSFFRNLLHSCGNDLADNPHQRRKVYTGCHPYWGSRKKCKSNTCCLSCRTYHPAQNKTIVRGPTVYGSGRESEPHPGCPFHLPCRVHSETRQPEYISPEPVHWATRNLKPTIMEKRLNSQMNLLSCQVAFTWGNPRPVCLFMYRRSSFVETEHDRFKNMQRKYLGQFSC